MKYQHTGMVEGKRRQMERLRPGPGWLTSHELADEIGATYRQVNHWYTAGWLTPDVPPSGSGSRVFFSPEEVEDARVFAALVIEGVYPSAVAEWLPQTRQDVLGAIRRWRAA